MSNDAYSFLSEDDALAPEAVVAEHFSKSTRTLWNWDKDERMLKLGWKPAVRINGRRYRRVGDLREFTQALLSARA
jgi:hypothetical protein